MAMRCFCPPESCRGSAWRALAGSRTMASSSRTRASGTWVVTQTVRSAGPASIIATFSGATPQRSATNSVWPEWVKPIA